MVISIFSNYQQKQIPVYAQQVVKILRRSDGVKSIKMSFKNVRYSAQKTVSNHLKCSYFFVSKFSQDERKEIWFYHSVTSQNLFCVISESDFVISSFIEIY